MKNKYIPRSEAEKLLGKRKVSKYFPDSDQISVVDLLKALLSENIRCLSSRKLSRILGVTSVTLRKWARENKIKCIKKSDKYWYDIQSVLRYLGAEDSTIRIGDRQYSVVSIITSSVPMGVGDVEENPEVVDKVLKTYGVSHECVVKYGGGGKNE